MSAMLALGAVLGTPAQAAYIFWMPPSFSGAPVTGDEPGIGLPMPGATPAELKAHLLWNMRAGLNVAALQCQFSPALMTVKNYNGMLGQHNAELNDAYQSITAYFKKKGGKWQVALDQYTTKTYNGFSTLRAQLGFCETAGRIGRAVLEAPRGKLGEVAQTRMGEFRNSLVPLGDRLFGMRVYIPWQPQLPRLDPQCWDKNDQLKKKCLV